MREVANTTQTRRIPKRTINDMSKCEVLQALETLFLHASNNYKPRVIYPKGEAYSQASAHAFQ